MHRRAGLAHFEQSCFKNRPASLFEGLKRNVVLGSIPKEDCGKTFFCPIAREL